MTGQPHDSQFGSGRGMRPDGFAPESRCAQLRVGRHRVPSAELIAEYDSPVRREHVRVCPGSGPPSANHRITAGLEHPDLLDPGPQLRCAAQSVAATELRCAVIPCAGSSLR